MSCSSPARELVTFWLAGTLEPADAALVSQHLETCADCRRDVADGRALIEGLRELHLTADEIVSAAAGERHDPHLLVCSRCRDEVAVLRAINADLDKAPSGSEPTGRQQSEPVPARWLRPALLAALAVAAALFAAVWLMPPRQTFDRGTLRGDGAVGVAGLTATIGSDAVPAFAWTPAANATSYRVDLFTDDGRPVWTRETDAPPMRWPDDVSRAAGTYRWRVEALAAGAVIARSRLASVQISR